MNSLTQRWITSPERWLAMLALLGFCWLAPARAQDSFGGGADLFPDFSLGEFKEVEKCISSGMQLNFLCLGRA